MSRPLPAATASCICRGYAPASCTSVHAHSAARSDGLWHAVTAAAKYLSLSFFALVVMTFSLKLLLQLPSIFSFPAFLMLLFWLFCGQMAFVLRCADGTEFAFAFGSSKPALENLPGLGPSPPALTCGPPVRSSSVRMLANGSALKNKRAAYLLILLKSA
jgi:hypothetical protein